MSPKPFYLALLLAAATAPAHAERDDFFADFRRDPTAADFVESRLPLPDVPDAEAGEWLDLYVSAVHRGRPRILLDSIRYAEDGSVRYLFNNRSEAGYDNISAEGILCSSRSFLDNTGSQIKTYAYADTANRRWIEPKNSGWKVLGGKNSSTDRVRRPLYEAFCIDGKAKDEAALKQRLVEQNRKMQRHSGK